MGKTTSTSDVLKNILKDVSNVQNIIDDSKKLEKNYTSVDFDNAQEVERIIEATKIIVDNLKAEAIKIHDYFDTNYETLNIRLTKSNMDMEAPVNNNNECDTVENDNESDSNCALNVNEVDKNMEDNTSTETTAVDKCNENDGEHSDKSNDIKKNSESTSEEPKMFLKCVDINKLINPDILPHLTSPKPLRSNNGDDTASDTVLIISDSEEEQLHKRNTKKDKFTKKESKLLRAKGSLREIRNVTKEKSSSKTFNNRKQEKSNTSSESDTVSTSTTRSNLRRRATAPKKYKEVSESEISSSSDSDSSIELPLTRNKNTSSIELPQRRCKNTKSSNINQNIVRDKKLFYKAYVPLPRIQCEKLKQHYLDQKQIDEVNRLTNLKNMKKRNRNNSNESSADSEKTGAKSKRTKQSSKASSSSEMDVSKEGNELTNVIDAVAGCISAGNDKEGNKIESEDVLDNILNRLSSESDKEEKTADDEEKGNNSKKQKKDHSNKDKDSSQSENENADVPENSNASEKQDGNSSDNRSDGHESEKSDDDKSEKKKTSSNWRKDKLLTGKLSDTDTEDEFEKFKKTSENAKSDLKARMKKKSKKVFSSDSDDSDNKKSSSEDESDKKNNSSNSSSEEDKKEDNTKKRRRIKRLNDSSDEDGNQTTRKTIRKVIAHESLAESTKRAEREEQQRKQRILERQKKYNQIFDSDKLEDATITKLVLDFNEETKEELLTVNNDLVKVLKPHQGKGVQFMWDACFESVERAKSTDGSGCILAHCMGLGKTLQVITLTHTLITNEETKVSKALVVCPLNTVLNWSAEYKKWLDEVDGPEIEVYELVSCKQNHREFVVEDWHKKGGALIIGYDMFRNLTNPNNKRLKKKAREIFHRGLVNPGPDLVVCDEGHLLKNEKTNLSVAMNRIRTARRIVLTGTPMQNNLKEYYCMVQFVKPSLLGTYKEYINRFVNPITNGQYTDSTSHDINIMRKRSHVLHKLLDGIVQRKDYAVLAPFLPPKYEYVLFLTLTETQINLYQYYKDNFSQRPQESKMKSTFLFSDFQEFQRICTHPRVLLMKSMELKNKFTSDSEEESEGSIKDFIDDDESEAKSTSSSSSGSDSDASVKSKPAKKSGPQKRLTRTAAAASGVDIDQVIAESKDTEGGEWWRQFCNGEQLDNIQLSSKLYLLFQILQECELIGDKLLVFSQSLYSLNVIEYFLSKIDDATQQGDQTKVCGFSGSWTLGLDYFRLDGSSSCDNRAAWCKNFNSLENPRARLFLISTKAGGLGINLVGANRVIIFDVSWNPSHDTQSIYRVYRFGQTKPCYIYRFVIWGAMEMKIYERQVTKQAISKRVIDEQQIDRHYNQNDLAELYKFDPKPTDQATPLVPKDVLLAELLQKEKDRIYKYHEHQSLLENKEDEVLDEEERKAAWEEFESEKTRVTTNPGMGWIRDLPVASVNIAVHSMIQKDNPGWTQDQIKRVIPQVVQQLRQQVEAGEMMLFERIVGEVRKIQEIQQVQYQEYIRKKQEEHQLRFLDHFRKQMLTQRGLGFPSNPNEVVELND